jgi:type I restriction enzyme S subunit
VSEAKHGERAGALRRYRPYPAYKDSGVEWLGEIPPGWEMKRLKYVAPARISKLDVKPDDAVYVGLENVESWTGRLLLDNQPETVDSVVGSFRAGDVLFGKLRPYLAKVARPDFDGVCTSEILPLRPVPDCSQSYVMYELLNAPYIRWLDSLTYGTKMPRVSLDQVASSFVCLPPLSEQRAIAAFLDRETARIDALVAKKERLIALLQEQRTALITRAVTKGLDPTVPMKDSGVEWLGEIPAHWEVKALSRTLLRITYGFTNPMPVADAGPYMLTAFDIGDGEILYGSARRTTEEAFDRLLTDKSRPRAGDLLITKDGTLGRVAVAGRERMCINQSVALLRFDPAVDVGFMQHTLRAAPYRERMTFEAGGTAIKHIYITRLARMSIALPAKEEQLAIATFLDRETARIDALVAKVRDAIERLKELRTALISAAVTGKIDVREEVA